MPAGYVLLAVLMFGLGLRADTFAPRSAPLYSGASIVNAADNAVGTLAPNTIATMYGVALAYTTKALSPSDIRGGTIPSILTGTGLRVLVGGIPAGIYYVSPTQINFLIPAILIPGPSDVQLTINGLAGPDIPIQLAASSPAFFQLDAQTVIANRPDYSVISQMQPVKAGDYIVLWVNGLGSLVPPLGDREVAMSALWITDMTKLAVTLDGVAVDPGLILYAGAAPGFAGLYQVNLKLPDVVGVNPEIRIILADQSSPAGIILPVE